MAKGKNYVYRCSRCRTRNRFYKSILAYKIPRRCRDCGYTKFYVDKERRNRLPCRCQGAYHWGPHRPGSPYCEKNPSWELQRAIRDGSDDGELAFLGLNLRSCNQLDPPF